MNLAELIQEGVRHHNAGRLAEAEPIYRQVLQVDPDQPDALHLLGLIAQSCGHPSDATELITRALRRSPDNGLFHANLSGVLAQTDQFEAAAYHGEQAVALLPNHADGHNNLGNIYASLERRTDAVECYRRAIAIDPNRFDTLSNLGKVLHRLGRNEEAAACYDQILTRWPADPNALHDLGLVRKNQGRLHEAAAYYELAMRLEPKGPAFWHLNLGNAYLELGRQADAMAAYDRAMAIDPDDKTVWNNASVALVGVGRLAEAESHIEKALKLDPNYHHARFARGILRLLQGDYANGWADYESRIPSEKIPPPPGGAPKWNGSDLNGKTILLWAEQGLGDTIQFIRYAPLLRSRGAKVIAGVQPPLVPVIRTCAGVDEVISNEGMPPAVDFWSSPMSLPLMFGTTLETIPRSFPYLRADPSRATAWEMRLGSVPGRKVGIVWQGNRKNPRDAIRSVRLQAFAPLAAVPGVTLLSLQTGPGADALKRGEHGFPIMNLGSEFGSDLSDIAGAMTHLDLILTVDTAVAHLAGAMGLPVWVLVPYAPDWRWLLNRDDSPWYPSMRLFRQEKIGEWGPVFEKVRAALMG